MASRIGRKLIRESEAALRTVYSVDAVSIQPKVANIWRKALNRPAPASGHRIGWKMELTSSMKRSSRFPWGAADSSDAPAPSSRSAITAYTWGTSLPMTTWYWPPAWTTVTTPSRALIPSVSAFASSRSSMRKRVAQCRAPLMLSSPPTRATMSPASVSKSTAMSILPFDPPPTLRTRAANAHVLPQLPGSNNPVRSALRRPTRTVCHPPGVRQDSTRSRLRDTSDMVGERGPSDQGRTPACGFPSFGGSFRGMEAAKMGA